MSEKADIQVIDMNKVEELFSKLKNLQIKHLNLLKELEFYKILINPPDTFVYINDLINKRKVWSCDNYEKLCGYTLDEANSLGEKYFQKAYHKEDKNIFLESSKEIARWDKTKSWKGVYRYKTKEGNFLWMYSIGRIFKYDSNNRPWLAIGIGFNITQTYSREEHLRKLMRENYELKHKSIKKLLSRQEKKVLKYLTDGFSSKEIAEKENLSCHTIETHRKNILKKLELNNTAELIKLATSGGLI